MKIDTHSNRIGNVGEPPSLSLEQPGEQVQGTAPESDTPGSSSLPPRMSHVHPDECLCFSTLYFSPFEKSVLTAPRAAVRVKSDRVWALTTGLWHMLAPPQCHRMTPDIAGHVPRTTQDPARATPQGGITWKIKSWGGGSVKP